MKAAPMLVDGQGVPALLNDGSGTQVVVDGQLAAEPWNGQRIPTHRADRIVDAKIRDLDPARPANEQFLGRA